MSNCIVTERECKAARLLHADGYPTHIIGPMFGLGDRTLVPHIRGECVEHAPCVAAMADAEAAGGPIEPASEETDV